MWRRGEFNWGSQNIIHILAFTGHAINNTFSVRKATVLCPASVTNPPIKGEIGSYIRGIGMGDVCVCSAGHTHVHNIV